MFNSLTRHRVQWIVTLGAILLVAYYFLLYWPLSNTVAFLDKPLTNLWQQLVVTNGIGRPAEILDRASATELLHQSQQARETLARQREQILKRVALEPKIEEKLRQPFQFIDFQNHRQERIEEITRLANQNQVALDPSVISGYPRYTVEQNSPASLWAEVAIYHQTLAAAIQTKVKSIQSARTQQLPQDAAIPSAPVEYRVALEFVAPMNSATRFLLAIPLRGDELRPLGLHESLATKPSLFLNQLLLRKASVERPDEVHVQVVISGFAYMYSQAPPQTDKS